MDVPRGKHATRRRILRRVLWGLVVLIVVPLVTWGLSRLKPAAPTVERAGAWIDTVKRGPMLRQVRGLGTLVPEEVLWIPAAFDGRVERVLRRPGVRVWPNDVLLVLSNPDMELAAADLEWQVKAAEAMYTDLKVKLESSTLDQKATTAQVKSEYTQANLTADRDRQLTTAGLKSDLETRLSVAKAEELENRYTIAQQRLNISGQSVDAQLAAQRVNIEKLRAAYELKRKQVQQLTIRAGAEGVLQQLPVEVGQRVTPGTILAKVAQPSKLKAELKIPETQAKDVQIGQVASIDTRNGIIAGHVMRIDPAVQNGTVTVDARLEGELPIGARPDLSVDGTIEIERLADILYVGRPVVGQEGSKVGLFKVAPDGKSADRVTVTLGRSSVTTIEIIDGLRVGDQVILSDMSAWDQHTHIQLN